MDGLVTQPGWDGRGQDPWLPQRLNARLEIAAVERSIRAEVWAALVDWLTGTRARVFRAGQAPDPDVIFAREPAWAEAVRALAGGEIRRALGIAYERLFGPGFDWQTRPFVTRYLGEVRNRLSHIPDEVHRAVTGELSIGVNLGEAVPTLADRVERVLSFTGQSSWEGRATTIARTEAIGAMNGGRFDAYAALSAELGEPLEQIWLATEDSRTRPTHDLADGQRVPLGQPFIVGGFELRFPGDPLGPPQEVINCRCTQLLVEPGESVDLSNRGYRG